MLFRSTVEQSSMALHTLFRQQETQCTQTVSYTHLKEDDVEFIRLQFTDIFGDLKNVAITSSPVSYTHRNKRLFVVDAFCGANADTRMAIRFIVEVAWQAHFVTNMFIKPTAEEFENFEPDFIVYNASKMCIRDRSCSAQFIKLLMDAVDLLIDVV